MGKFVDEFERAHKSGDANCLERGKCMIFQNINDSERIRKITEDAGFAVGTLQIPYGNPQTNYELTVGFLESELKELIEHVKKNYGVELVIKN